MKNKIMVLIFISVALSACQPPPEGGSEIFTLKKIESHLERIADSLERDCR